jgi:hypothetical protein
MGYDLELADRARAVLVEIEGYSEREMFGGIGFMIHGNMSCGVNGEDLIVRVGPDAYEESLSDQHVRVFDMTGRPMRGWVVVGAEALATQKHLTEWVRKGLAFAQSLPPK